MVGPQTRRFRAHDLYYIYQRSSRGQPLFPSVHDHGFYLELLVQYAERFRVLIHAYAILPNEVRFLLEPLTPRAISRLFQTLQSTYARYIHARLGVRGHLWQHKYGAHWIPEPLFEAAVAHIEGEAVRQRLAKSPRAYRWSSARAHYAGPAGAYRRGLPELCWDRYLFTVQTPPGPRPGAAPIGILLTANPQSFYHRYGPASAEPRVPRRS